MTTRATTSLCMALLGLFAFSDSHAQGPEDAPGGTLVAKVIGDYVLVRATLSTELLDRDTYLLVDYNSARPLTIHSQLIRNIRYGDGETTLKVLAQGFRLEVPKDEVTLEPGPLIDWLAVRHGDELEGIAIAGVIGFPALRPFSMALDLADGRLTLTPSGGEHAQRVERSAKQFIRGVRVVGNQTYVPVTYDGGKRAMMRFGVGGYHTYVNRDIAAALRQPLSSPDDVRFGEHGGEQLSLSGMAALRPQDFGEPDAEIGNELVRSGLSLWSGYRLEIDPNRGYLALTQLLDSNFRQADFAFYSAAANPDLDDLRTFVATFPKDRNMEEAAALMFQLGLDANLSVDDQMKAIAAGLSVTPEKFKAEYVGGFVFPLYESRERDKRTLLIIALGEEVMRHIGQASDPRLRQFTQLMLGDRYLHAGDAHEGWKYLLSAAFRGDPELEAVVRHELGRAYEALGRHRRAYSSYQRAIPDHVQGPVRYKQQAREALERLRPLLDSDDPLLKGS